MSEQTGINKASCQKTIVDWKKTQLAANIPNYCKLGEGSVAYTDSLYPAKDSSLYWSAMPTSRQSRNANQPWMRLSTKYPSSTLYGTGNWQNDVQQGDLGNCYFMAAASSASE
jgi:hypothetical protein